MSTNGPTSDREREHDVRLPGEDLDRPVERSVEPRRGCRHGGAALGASSSWMVAMRASRRRRRDSHAAAAARARAAARRASSVGRARPPLGPLELGRERCDLRPQALALALERVDRLLQVVDLHLLGDDRAERREPRDGVLHLAPSARAASATTFRRCRWHTTR